MIMMVILIIGCILQHLKKI